MGDYDDRPWWGDLVAGIAGHARRSVGLVYLDELAADWVAHQRAHRAPCYADQCRSVLGLLLDACPTRMPVAALTVAHVEAVLEAGAGRGLTHKSLSNYRRVLSAFCSYAIERELMRHNVAAAAQLPAGQPSKPRQSLPREWVGPFLAACSRAFRPIASCAILAGLRRVEVVRLRWPDVLPDRLRVFTAKQAAPRYDEVPLHPRLADELAAVERISEWVFPVRRASRGRARGDQRSERSRWFLQQVRYTAGRLGMPAGSVTFHGLRHTFGMLVQSVTGDAWLAGMLLRHSGGAVQGRESTVSHLYFDLEWGRMVEAVHAIRIDELRPVRGAR